MIFKQVFVSHYHSKSEASRQSLIQPPSLHIVLWLCIVISLYKFYTARKYTFNELKKLEREPLRYFKYDGKVTCTRHFLMLGKVTFDEHVNVLERYCKGDI